MTKLNKNIVISANSSWNIINFRTNLINALIQKGYEIIIIAPNDSYSKELYKLKSTHIPIPIDSKSISPIKDLILLFRYWKILRREKPIAFLSYTIKPNIYGSIAAHILKIPTINNISGLGTTFIHKNLVTHIVKILYRIALYRSHKVFFQNKDDKSIFITSNIVAKNNISLLPGSGVDLKYFYPNKKTPQPHKKSICFLLIARLIWDKGIGEYVEAARIVRQNYPDAKFQILGFINNKNKTAIDPKKLKKWIDEGLIDYLGGSDDVRPYITNSDCVVLPSYREGTPRTLLEAAAMGKPLIATDVPGCREVIDAGKNGFLCRARDAKDLAINMINFINLDKSKQIAMGLESRKKVECEFDEKIVIDKYLETLQELNG